MVTYPGWERGYVFCMPLILRVDIHSCRQTARLYSQHPRARCAVVPECAPADQMQVPRL